jgi:hypothetical protein
MTRPMHLTITAYDVGFGDCFLLQFIYPDTSKKHVLIDFGSTKLPTIGPKSIADVARQIDEDCGHKLDMVVVTHRHSDHVSGFDGTSGRIIAELKPELVVQPWTEDPEIDPDAKAPAGSSPAAHALAASQRAAAVSLRDMHTVASRVRTRAANLQATGHAPKTLAEEIHFLGETNIKNPGAVRNLMTMGKRRVYASFGTRLPIASILPGVKITVLGPPTLEQSPGIASLASRDATEYWHLAATMSRRSGADDTEPLFPDARKSATIPQVAKWVVPQIDKMSAEELLAIVRSVDDALNNTSLILLFDIGGTKLLFPGDAQIENWRYALFQAPNSADIKKELTDAALYKVGHHGSLNGTPKTLWFAFKGRQPPNTPGRLKTLISTLGGKHGKASRGTEVPRGKLMDELEAQSDLTTTQTLRSKQTWWRKVEIDFPP